MKINWGIFLVILIVVGCKSSQTGNASGADVYANYQEDLSLTLPEYDDFEEKLSSQKEEEMEISVQSVDNQLLDLQRKGYEKNKSELYFSGYTVLVYSGVNRDQAFKTQEDLNTYFPDIKAEMQYQQPRYLLKIGRYAYKFEAQKVFSQIKGTFPTARIIQDRFQRKEYVSPTTDSNAERQN